MSKKNLPSTRKDLGGGVYLYRDPGTSVAQLQVAQAELPPPEQAFMADAFGIYRTSTRVEIGFCQRALGGAGGIGAAVMISVPLSDIRALLYENSVDFFAQLQRGCASRTANDDAVSADYANVPVGRVIKERANLLAMAYTGDDAEVRFYKIAAYEFSITLRETNPKKKTIVHPVIQIDMPVSVLCALSTELHRVVPNREGE